jgi:alanyl-tRNA synthetase
MQEPYPELKTRRENIACIIMVEEGRFKDTLRAGTQILTEIIERLKKEGKDRLPGEIVFNLYDTYGFPMELTESISRRYGFKLEKERFKQAMDEQRQRSKSKSQIIEGIFSGVGGMNAAVREVSPTKFLGYEEDQKETKVLLILRGEVKVKEAAEGERIGLILKETPFYGEAGGQVGDRGRIENDDVKLEVVDTKLFSQRIVHIADVVKGKIRVGDKVNALIDKDYRNAIRRSHTATHLLQAALRKVLGPHIEQSGSWVGADRFRFDFTHFKPLDERELVRIEKIVNENIMCDEEVTIQYMSLNEAKKRGALALFGEKYGDRVRVVSIADYSKELCGGTHVNSTGKIRLFYITQEASIASGVRRIEAITANAAYESWREDREIIRDTLKLLNISEKEKLIPALEEIYSTLKDLKRKLKKLDLERGRLLINNIISQAKEIKGVKIIGSKIENADFKLLRHLADLVITKVKPCVVSLVSVLGEKVLLVIALTPDLVSRQLDARRIISTLAKLVGGEGGGRVDFALGGGKQVSEIDRLLKELPKIVEKEIGK